MVKIWMSRLDNVKKKEDEEKKDLKKWIKKRWWMVYDNVKCLKKICVSLMKSLSAVRINRSCGKTQVKEITLFTEINYLNFISIFYQLSFLKHKFC